MAMPKFRAMELGDIFDMAIKLYRENFATFLGTVGVVLAPVYIMMSYFQSFIMDPAMMLKGLAALYLLIFIFLGILWPLSETAITKVVSERFLEHEISIMGAYRFVGSRIPLVLGTFFLGGVGIFLGTFFCIIPGIVISCFLSFLPQVMIIEGLGFFDAMGRSRKIFLASPGKCLLLFFLITIIVYLVNITASIIANLGVGLVIKEPGSASITAYILTYMVSLLFVPFTQASHTLLYYDIRIRKEGFDLEQLAASLGYGVEAALCPACSRPFKEEDLFCGNCGKELR